MLPLLQLVADGAEHSIRETVAPLASHFGLTAEERDLLLPSGQQTTFSNRVGWARTYLKEAGLLEAPRRGYLRITQRGREVLARSPKSLNYAFLEQFPEFLAFRSRRRERAETGAPEPAVLRAPARTPEEEIDDAYQRVREGVAAELIQAIKACSPAFFERLVVDLVLKMGYGGTRADAGQAIGRTGDGGIDGIIKEDRLGLDAVYLQAKRWEQVVGRPEVQKFAGTLQGHRARKGILITTSSFTRDAHQYASSIDSKIVLLDGDALAQLMIDHNVGVNPVATYELKRIDSDYFVEGNA
jgi:restriction system protein